jgi:thiol-disulfide isomerase/thioredoxin
MNIKTITLIIILSLSMSTKIQIRDDGIKFINHENFNQLITSEKNVLILFYSPTCSHCKQFYPTNVQVTEFLKKKELPVLPGKLDVTDPKNSEILKKYDVTGWPKLILFVNGEAKKFEGDKRLGPIMTWIKENI